MVEVRLDCRRNEKGVEAIASTPLLLRQLGLFIWRVYTCPIIHLWSCPKHTRLLYNVFMVAE